MTTSPHPTPLAIGVALAPRFEHRGDSLADARAYEAAGCDSLWLEGEEDPWLAAAAIAVVTARVRLVVPVTAGDFAPAAMLSQRAATLQRLASGRLDVCCAITELTRIRPLVRGRVFCAVDGSAGASDASADGLILPADAPFAARARSAIWRRCEVPSDRAAWRQLLARIRQEDAAGAVVRETPRLLDLLRNPDQDGDRSDLELAHG